MRYELQQFHFHHPSEEAVKGKLTDMEVHLVHKSTDGKLAVLAVRLTRIIGDPNAVLAALWHICRAPRAQRQDDGLCGCRWPASRRPRLLDLHRIAHHAALHRGRTLVCLRAGSQHQPRAVARLHLDHSDELAAIAGHARAEDRSQRMSISNQLSGSGKGRSLNRMRNEG